MAPPSAPAHTEDDRPFRRAVWRGMGVVLPPLLTVVIFLWMGSTIQYYVLTPVHVGVRNVLAWQLRENYSKDLPIDSRLSDGTPVARTPNNELVVQLADKNFVPIWLYDVVRGDQSAEQMPTNPRDAWRRYVELRYLNPYWMIPTYLVAFIVLMYLLGKFLAAGVGSFFWNMFERGIRRVPLVRNVYDSVKQVTDFMFDSSEIDYTRVVAVEYPRKGIWSLGLVTGESLADIGGAAKEPVLCVFIPGSPMPVTGVAVTVLKKDCVDLNITIDQALQFIVSCGVVVPPQQLRQEIDDASTRLVASEKEK